MQRLAYSVKEVAVLIGVSARTVVREIQRGRLCAVRCGRRVLVPVEALEDFLGITASVVPSVNLEDTTPTRERQGSQ